MKAAFFGFWHSCCQPILDMRDVFTSLLCRRKRLNYTEFNHITQSSCKVDNKFNDGTIQLVDTQPADIFYNHKNSCLTLTVNAFRQDVNAARCKVSVFTRQQNKMYISKMLHHNLCTCPSFTWTIFTTNVIGRHRGPKQKLWAGYRVSV